MEKEDAIAKGPKKNQKNKYLKILIVIFILLILILCDYIFIVRKNRVSAPTSKNQSDQNA